MNHEIREIHERLRGCLTANLANLYEFLRGICDHEIYGMSERLGGAWDGRFLLTTDRHEFARILVEGGDMEGKEEENGSHDEWVRAGGCGGGIKKGPR